MVTWSLVGLVSIGERTRKRPVNVTSLALAWTFQPARVHPHGGTMWKHPRQQTVKNAWKTEGEASREGCLLQGEVYARVVNSSNYCYKRITTRDEALQEAQQLIDDRDWSSDFFHERATTWQLHLATTPDAGVIASYDLLVDAIRWEIHSDEELRKATLREFQVQLQAGADQ